MATRADGDLRQVITQANQLERKTNIKGRVTLTANTTKTVVTELQMGFGSAAALCPMTANAAAELASGACFISEYGPGNFTITHRNSAQTDRKFAYGVWV